MTHTINEKNALHERAIKDYIEGAITADKLLYLRTFSEKWNEQYLKTFHAHEIENNILNTDTLIYFAKKIAVIVTKANFKRSGNSFDYRLYLSVCGYDYFNGNITFENVGGDEVIGEAVRGAFVVLNAVRSSGLDFIKLDEEILIDGNPTTAFKYICKYINKHIHAQRNRLENISGFDIERIGAINSILRDTAPQSIYNALQDIISHIKLTKNMLRYLDCAVNGMSRREIAKLENKHPSTICEAFVTIKNKFIKYCLENEINPAVVDFLTVYIAD